MVFLVAIGERAGRDNFSVDERVVGCHYREYRNDYPE